jgi:hypothetical protein
MKKGRRKWGRVAREDKSTLSEPRCPFCSSIFERPSDIPTELGFFYGGKCACGAVFACDPTGRNLGEAYMDALSYACREDWDLAMSLNPDSDYEEKILNYNPQSHTVLPKKTSLYHRSSSGKLLFIKIGGDIVTDEAEKESDKHP